MPPLPRSKHPAAEWERLIREGSTSTCRQHDAAVAELAALIVRYPQITRVRRAFETSSRRERNCQLEVKLALSKAMSHADRDEFIARAEKLGWKYLPNHEEQSIHLVSPAGVRQPNGELPPAVGTLRVAIFVHSRNLLGENLTMHGQPSEDKYRPLLERETEGRSNLVVRRVRWDGKSWQPLGDDAAPPTVASTPESEVATLWQL
jgi:hypothetical protein